MRYLGIDYGAKRIGLAISSEGIAFPQGVLQNDQDFFPALADLISKERIESIVVGDTRAFGGAENPITPELEEFIAQLKEKTSLPVMPANEAGSSVEASRYEPRERKHDDAAAAFILQRFLDMRGKI